jgi:hypothetical protein
MLTKVPRERAFSGTVAQLNPTVTALINEIAESEVFRAAPAMRKLLVYLWQNQGGSISEYAIATEALGRPSDFDSRTDASVRVQVARLRAKLNEFYAREGKNFPLQLRIPVGGHEIEWSLEREAEPTPAPVPVTPEIPKSVVPKPSQWPLIASITVAILLAITCGVLTLRLTQVKKSATIPAPLPPFWSRFLANDKQSDIVVPDLPVFRWPDHHVYLLDGRESSFEKWPESPAAALLAQKWGPPILSQTLIFGRDAFAGYKIDQYIEQHGKSIEIMEGSGFAADRASTHNTIFVGLPNASPYIRGFAERMNFRVSSGIPLIIENRRPVAGEPTKYEEKELSEKRRICPAVIALLPPKADGARTLVLTGRYANAFSSMLLSADGLKRIEDSLRHAGSPDAWEMVIEAEIENTTTIVRTTPLAVRAISPTFWN